MTINISHLLFILCNNIGLVSLLFQRLAQFYYSVHTLYWILSLNFCYHPYNYLHFLIQRIFSLIIITSLAYISTVCFVATYRCSFANDVWIRVYTFWHTMSLLYLLLMKIVSILNNTKEDQLYYSNWFAMPHCI